MCIVRLDYSNRVVNKGLEDIFPDDPNYCSEASENVTAAAVSTTTAESTCISGNSDQTGSDRPVAPPTTIRARTISLHSVISSHTASSELPGGPSSAITTTGLASVARRPHRYSEGSSSHLQWEASSQRFRESTASWLSRLSFPPATSTFPSPATRATEPLSPNQAARAAACPLLTPSEVPAGEFSSIGTVGQAERTFGSLRRRFCTDEPEGVRPRESPVFSHQSKSGIGNPTDQVASEISPSKRIRTEMAGWPEPSTSMARERMEQPEQQLSTNVLIPWGLFLKPAPKITGTTSALDLLLMTESEAQQFRRKTSTERLASGSLRFHPGQPGPSSSAMQTCHPSPPPSTSAAAQGVEGQASLEEVAGPSTSIMRHLPSREHIPTETGPGAATSSSRDHPPAADVTDVTAAAAAAAAAIYPPEHSFRPSEAAKCRKVYGAINKSKWCKQCRWKKACTRFQGPPRSP